MFNAAKHRTLIPPSNENKEQPFCMILNLPIAEEAKRHILQTT